MVMTEPVIGDRGSKKRPSDVIAVSIVTFIAVGLLFAPIYALLRGHSAEPVMGDRGGTAVSLSTLDPSLAQIYKAAKAHGSHFEQFPCFCGCQEGRLEHRQLLDCYVLRDGTGWESHAIGCGICQGEARTALQMLKADTPVDEIRARIIDEFGMPDEMRDL